MDLLVFTDLDGTLLDAHSYSAEPARPMLAELERRGVPVVFCTSKTRAEVLALREELGNREAFIVENGGGVFLPCERLGGIREHAGFEDAGGGLLGLVLGRPYEELRRALTQIRGLGYGVRGFGDMPAEEVAALVGLPLPAARLARQREFDEPFVLLDGESRIDEIRREITRRGLFHTSGRLHHVLGNNDKGRALARVRGLYEALTGRTARTVALGDSPNDVPMLRAADLPVLVRRPEGDWHPEVLRELEGTPAGELLLRSDAAGPAGWAEALASLLAEQE